MFPAMIKFYIFHFNSNFFLRHITANSEKYTEFSHYLFRLMHKKLEANYVWHMAIVGNDIPRDWA